MSIKMERRLIVMRHGKSSWSSPATTDHQRPLNERGRHNVPTVARHLAEISWQPQHILSSDAQRTRETAELLLGEWEVGIGIEYTSNLYLSGPSDLKIELCAVSDEVETLLVLGHNPGWEEVVYRLTSLTVTMKTGTCALLTGECESWCDAFKTTWSVEDTIYPRELY